MDAVSRLMDRYELQKSRAEQVQVGFTWFRGYVGMTVCVCACLVGDVAFELWLCGIAMSGVRVWKNSRISTLFIHFRGNQHCE